MTIAPATIDVNQKLFQERARMMDATGASLNNRGQVVVNGGWDRGEVLGKAALDMSKGSAALYTSTTAWHGLGNVIPGGISDVEKVLELGGIDYEVVKVPATYEWMGKTYTHADKFHTVRTDTGAALGIVGKGYSIIQPEESFRFIQELVESGYVVWESAGALNGGRKVFVCARLPEDVIVDEGGINDEIRPFIDVVDSYDGSSSFWAGVTPWRIVCENTERFAREDAITRWKTRHTTNATARLEEARKTLKLTSKYYEVFAEEQTALARTEMAIAEFDKVIEDLYPKPDEDVASKAKMTRDIQFRDRLRWLFAESPTTANCRGTAYAAERAITEYWDWCSQAAKPDAEKPTDLAVRAHRVFEGVHDGEKTRAHQRLMLTRTNR